MEHRTVRVTDVRCSFGATSNYHSAELAFEGSYGGTPTRDGAIAAFSALVHPIRWDRDYIEARPVPGTEADMIVSGQPAASAWRVLVRRERV